MGHGCDLFPTHYHHSPECCHRAHCCPPNPWQTKHWRYRHLATEGEQPAAVQLFVAQPAPVLMLHLLLPAPLLLELEPQQRLAWDAQAQLASNSQPRLLANRLETHISKLANLIGGCHPGRSPTKDKYGVATTYWACADPEFPQVELLWDFLLLAIASVTFW
jgi:hypothetical protein